MQLNSSQKTLIKKMLKTNINVIDVFKTPSLTFSNFKLENICKKNRTLKKQQR